MKKLLLCLLALALLIPAALAEVQVETIPLENTIYLSDATNCYYMRVSGGYQLFDADGNPLSAVYKDLTAKRYGAYYEYYGSGVNYIGLLDAKGQVICEPAYGTLTVLDENWLLGYVLEVTDAETGDFSNRSTGEKYMMQRADVFYQGRMIGSLTREEFAPNMTAGVTGNYLFVRVTSGNGYWIDRDFNITRVEKDFTSSEFTEIYNKGVLHNPTQQYAYCEGCTLTQEDTRQTVRYDDDTDQIVDLQGRVVASKINYDNVRLYGDYFSIRLNRLYGVMDKQGNVIVEPIYKEISTNSDGIFANGVLTAITPEGHLHFINEKGEVTAKAEYELNSSDYKGFSYSARFAVINNLGKYIVITSEMGELPTKYEEVYTPHTQDQILLVKKGGLWGAIDVQGNTVLPFIHNNAPELTEDGSLAFAYDQNRDKYLYRLTYDGAETEAATPATPAPAVEAPATPQADGWACPACGTENTGKFCGNCGSAKPVATPTPEPTHEPTPAPANDGSWTCGCGSVNAGKFCPECGSPKPEAAPAEPQCASCGYKPEGDAPKFCPECGTKF